MKRTKLWTRDFVRNCLICFLLNLAYYMVMVVVTDYASTQMGATLGEAGFVCGVFILGALFARLFIGGSLERLGLKRVLYLGTGLFLGGMLLNFFAMSIWSLSAVRFLQGIGFGIGSTATGTVMAELVPPERRGEGTSYYAMFVTMGTAIGPFAGLYCYQGGSLMMNLIVSTVFLILSVLLTVRLRVPALAAAPAAAQDTAKRPALWQRFLEPSAIPMAFITLLVSLGFASILSFITSFEKEAGLLEAGKYFFMVYAVVTVLSRPFSGRLFDKRGDNFVLYPSFVVFAAGLLLLSQTHSGMSLMLVAVCLALGFGTYMSCAQAVVIKLAPRHHIGLATSTFFIFMDFGVGLGPLLLGLLLSFMDFRGLYALLAGVLLCCTGLYYWFHGRKAQPREEAEQQPAFHGGE